MSKQQQLLNFFCLVALSSCAITDTFIPSNQLQVAVSSSNKSYMDPSAERASKAMYEFLVGQMEFKGQDLDSALEHLTKASELSDDVAPVLNTTLANLFLRRGDLAKALIEVDKVLASNPLNIDLLLLKAGLLEGLNRGSEALLIYEQARRIDAKRFDPTLLLAKAYERAGRMAESLAVFENFSRTSQSEPLANYFLALAYENRNALGPAEVAMREAIKRDPSNSSMSLELIRILIKQRNFKAAKDTCQELLNKDRNNQVAARLLSQLSLGPQDIEDAVLQLQSHAPKTESVVDSHFRVAVIQIDRKDFVQAAQELLFVIAIEPEHSQARYYLASLYAGSGRKKEAIEQLMAIKKGQELYVKARTLASFVMRQDGDLASAEIAARDALDADPDDRNILSYLMLILRDAKKLDAAADLMADAIEREPGNERLLFNYAVLLHDMGRDNDSQVAMEKVIEANPEHSDALNYVAYGLIEKKGDLARAQRLVEKALSIRPNDGYYLDTLGWLYYTSGKYLEAEAVLKRAVSSTSNDLVILEHYADTLVKLERYELALDAYRSAIERGRDSAEKSDKEVVERMEGKVETLLRMAPEFRPTLNRL